MRIRALAAVLLVTIAASCQADEFTESPTAERVEAPTETTRSYPGPEQQAGYPGPSSESGYPGPAGEVRAEVAKVPLGEARFPGQLAFHSEQAGAGLQLYLFDGQDGTVSPITGGVTQAYEPSWNQDCTTIVYTQQSGANSIDLYTTSLDTFEAFPFLEAITDDLFEWTPAWTPEGDRIAYQVNPNARMDICFADASGLILNCIEEGLDNADPAFSPDGRQMAFVSNRDGDWEIFSISADGTGAARQLTHNDATDLNPTFSPDGSFILFESNVAATHDIYSMRADGTELTRLTDMIENEREPEWIGEDLIVFSSNEDGDYDLYLMEADGANIRQITDYEGKDGGAAWCLPG